MVSERHTKKTRRRKKEDWSQMLVSSKWVLVLV